MIPNHHTQRNILHDMQHACAITYSGVPGQPKHTFVRVREKRVELLFDTQTSAFVVFLIPGGMFSWG